MWRVSREAINRAREGGGPTLVEAKTFRFFGHSLGGQIAAQYAAWDFDGGAGYQDLAGLVLIDAVTGGEGQPSAITQAQYETDGFMDPDGFGTVQPLNEVRASTRFFSSWDWRARPAFAATRD